MIYMKELNFERKYFVKDLFDPKKVLDNFAMVYFESFSCFEKCIMNDLYIIKKGKMISFPVKNEDGLQIAIPLFEKTDILEKCISWIKIEDRHFYFNPKDNSLMKMIYLNKDNYAETIASIINDREQKYMYFIRFDYTSFLELKVGELNELQFWIERLNCWIGDIKIFKMPQFYKTVSISNDLKLYLDKSGKSFFDLGANLDKNGETLPFLERNELGTFMDLTKQGVQAQMPVRNWNLIDWEQNVKMNGFVNEIPLITSLIDSWFLNFPIQTNRNRDNKKLRAERDRVIK